MVVCFDKHRTLNLIRLDLRVRKILAIVSVLTVENCACGLLKIMKFDLRG